MDNKLLNVNLAKSVVQHNAITSARYDFNACQMDILFMLLALINNTDLPDKAYSIYLKDIEIITGRSWNYQQLKLATEEMGSKMFSVQTVQKELQIWLFQGVEYQDGKGYFDITISQIARPFLFNLKNNFTVMQVKSALTCRSKYAKRLYALSCQWKTVGELIIPVAGLKEMLYLKDPNNLEKEQFKGAQDFKRYVLDVAKEQINANTDINFNYEFIKEGRAITSIKIIIGRQKRRQLEIDFTTDVTYQKHVAIINAYGLNLDAAKKVAIKHYDIFLKIVEELNALIKGGKKIENNNAYLVGVLKKKGIL